MLSFANWKRNEENTKKYPLLKKKVISYRSTNFFAQFQSDKRQQSLGFEVPNTKKMHAFELQMMSDLFADGTACGWLLYLPLKMGIQENDGAF